MGFNSGFKGLKTKLTCTAVKYHFIRHSKHCLYYFQLTGAYHLLRTTNIFIGTVVVQLVQTLCYKLEGRGFDS